MTLLLTKSLYFFLQDIACSNSTGETFFRQKTFNDTLPTVRLRLEDKIRQIRGATLDTECFKIFSAPEDISRSEKRAYIHYDAIVFFLSLFRKSLTSNLQMNLLLYNMLHPDQLLYTKKYAKTPVNATIEGVVNSIEEELIECGKSVFLADVEEIARWKTYLTARYPWEKFYVSKQTIYSGIVGWSFDTYEGTKASIIPKMFKGMVETGLYERARDTEREMKFRKRRMRKIAEDEGTRSYKGLQADRKTALKLGGSIDTIFIIWAALLTGSILAFLSEIFRLFCSSVDMHRM